MRKHRIAFKHKLFVPGVGFCALCDAVGGEPVESGVNLIRVAQDSF